MVDISGADAQRHINALGSSVASDLFQILRDGRPRTRSELSAITGLARSTVALRIDALMKLGLVDSVGDAVSTGGRPSSQSPIATGGRVVVGVAGGATHVRIAVSDLAGGVLAQAVERMNVSEGPEKVLSWVISAAERLLASVDRASADLLAIGIGLPGPVEHSTGRP